MKNTNAKRTNNVCPSLMTLARETRMDILRYCLVMEGDINPHPADYEKSSDQAVDHKIKDKPAAALLMVNKTLNEEANVILYSENTWRMGNFLDSIEGYFTPSRIWSVHRGEPYHL